MEAKSNYEAIDSSGSDEISIVNTVDDTSHVEKYNDIARCKELSNERVPDIDKQTDVNNAKNRVSVNECNVQLGDCEDEENDIDNLTNELRNEIYINDFDVCVAVSNDDSDGLSSLLVEERNDSGSYNVKADKKKGWRKPKSRTVMPSVGSAGTNRETHAHENNAEFRDEETLHNGKDKDGKKKNKNKEDMASVLIEGVLFRARYLGSTQLACEGQPTKATRMLQAEEAVSRIKAPEGENQPSTEVDLFISTEKIMVLNTELKEIMMDHALRTISYIADIGDLVVLMARRRFVPHETDSDQPKLSRTPKMICHVFESEEAQFIAQSIGQAFQVAYMEFLKANGIEDHSFVKEMDYQEVLNSQEIFGDELQMFAKKELQKEVVVPKTKGEILGVVVVESGWGSMLPTVVIANLAPAGAAARCGQLNIGDQIIAINGVSLVGLPLSTCQTYVKNSKNQTVVKLTVVPCAPVVEVKIKRPDTKYQLGFSVQNGVICSLLRGGIAERGGVRVGHRIIEINSQSVVAVPHERIVNLLATSVGEILMKTMPTSMFRLLTGQENPVFI
ncbi:protein lin-10-like isoform X2 [Leptidea sinapis]|uniref:protein lin-10-like isoform X2 n=1 Tax=Leptidea sinapis TaxID=189913 RepID=UPI0021C48499|nr:protein lin-10-like isoform X2 [Leptidea sinapis]